MVNFKFTRKKILLLGSGELGKELVIEAKRLGLEVFAIDKYENAPAMQVADHSLVVDMSNKDILSKTIKDLKPDFVVPEIEALSIESLKEIEEEGITGILESFFIVEFVKNVSSFLIRLFKDEKLIFPNAIRDFIVLRTLSIFSVIKTLEASSFLGRIILTVLPVSDLILLSRYAKSFSFFSRDSFRRST